MGLLLKIYRRKFHLARTCHAVLDSHDMLEQKLSKAGTGGNPNKTSRSSEKVILTTQ